MAVARAMPPDEALHTSLDGEQVVDLRQFETRLPKMCSPIA